jgi:hypothetical protein
VLDISGNGFGVQLNWWVWNVNVDGVGVQLNWMKWGVFMFLGF